MGHVQRFAANPNAHEAQIIFSHIDGFVVASWPGTELCVRLGTYDAVTAGMNDFVAQCEVGRELAQHAHRLLAAHFSDAGDFDQRGAASHS